MLATLYTSYDITKLIGSETQNTGSPNKLLSFMTVCRHAFHGGVMAYMLQFDQNALRKQYL